MVRKISTHPANITDSNVRPFWEEQLDVARETFHENIRGPIRVGVWVGLDPKIMMNTESLAVLCDLILTNETLIKCQILFSENKLAS